MKPLCLAILAAVALWWFCYPEPTRTLPEQFTAAEAEYYAARHRHHGIGGSVVDLRTGERSFDRGGVKCRL